MVSKYLNKFKEKNNIQYIRNANHLKNIYSTNY